MDRKLLDYLPPVLREVTDFRAINNANEPELVLAWDALSKVLANQFLEDADQDGVSCWERELKIYPKDTDTLAVRKAHIKARWNLETPYTIPWLRRWIDGFGGAIRHKETIDGYTLRLELSYDAAGIDCSGLDTFIQEIRTMLLAVRPANILVDLTKISVVELDTDPILVGAGLGLCLSSTELPVRDPMYQDTVVPVSSRIQGLISIIQPPERLPAFHERPLSARGLLKSSLAITALPELNREESQ